MFANNASPSPLPPPLQHRQTKAACGNSWNNFAVGSFGCRCNRCHTWSMPFPKTCFSPLQIFPKRVGVGSRSRGPKPAAKIDHVTNVVGSCWWRRVFLLHRMASYRLASPRVVSFRFYSSCWLPLADAGCCQVRLKRTFDWFVGGSERERERGSSILLFGGKRMFF